MTPRIRTVAAVTALCMALGACGPSNKAAEPILGVLAHLGVREATFSSLEGAADRITLKDLKAKDADGSPVTIREVTAEGILQSETSWKADRVAIIDAASSRTSLGSASFKTVEARQREKDWTFDYLSVDVGAYKGRVAGIPGSVGSLTFDFHDWRKEKQAANLRLKDLGLDPATLGSRHPVLALAASASGAEGGFALTRDGVTGETTLSNVVLRSPVLDLSGNLTLGGVEDETFEAAKSASLASLLTPSWWSGKVTLKSLELRFKLSAIAPAAAGGADPDALAEAEFEKVENPSARMAFSRIRAALAGGRGDFVLTLKPPADVPLTLIWEALSRDDVFQLLDLRMDSSSFAPRPPKASDAGK